MKIKTKLMIIVIISMIAITIIFTFNTISAYQKHLHTHLKELKEETYKTTKSELVNYVDMANKVIDSYYQRTKKDKIQKELKAYIDEQSNYLFSIIDGVYLQYHNKIDENILKKMIYSIIEQTRYGTSGYFWINDFNYKMIMHPIKKEYTGKYFKSSQKVPFVALGIEKLNQLQTNKAYIQYSFYSPNSKKYKEKASVIRVFKPYNWIIGTGAYIDDLTHEMQKEALNAIKHMRYGKNGYFWINDMNNKMLMHPIKPQYDNKYFIDTPKVPFVQLGTKKLKELKQSQAFIQYRFYTPETKQYSHKLSIVKLYKPWQWVIGTGTYTDYLDKKIENEKLVAQQNMQKQIQNTILITLIVVMILIFIMVKFLEKTIIQPLETFQQGLNQFFKFLSDETVDVKKLTNTNNDEIGIMSQKANSAIEIAVKTHQELLDLRKQLELQVKQTTQDLDITKEKFNIINQNTKEALEYGALIQKSILPEKKLLNEVFKNHFIFHIQHDIISSQFYIFEKIQTNEYLYIIIDSKKDGINGVFTTMLINAIIKQAITQIKYNTNQEISTSWILEYLNTNIQITDGFDAAIVYYNRNTHNLKYSGANLPIHYFQDDSFHIITPDEYHIGIEKTQKYTEHIIDTKEYIEFYIATHHYIKNYIDIYNFTSPFLTTTNQFKINPNTTEDDIIISGFQIDNKPQVLIEYTGIFTQQLINKYMEEIEDKVENIGLMSNISTTFVEQYQNILNYGKSEDITIQDITPKGSIKLQKNSDNTYSIITKNILTMKDKQKIEPKLFEIESLDKDAIRKRYRELRKSGINTHAKGGGIGFYEIAKRCLNIQYTFNQINEDRFEFTFISLLGKK